MRRAAPETLVAGREVSRVLVERRVQAEGEGIANAGPGEHRAGAFRVSAAALAPLRRRIECLEHSAVGCGAGERHRRINAFGMEGELASGVEGIGGVGSLGREGNSRKDNE